MRCDGVDSAIIMGDDLGITLMRVEDTWIYLGTVESDYSRFDSTQRHQAIRTEHLLWRYFGMDLKAIRLSMAMHRAKIRASMTRTKITKNKGEICTGVKIQFDSAIRLSGGWNTSLGNSVVNMLAVVANIEAGNGKFTREGFNNTGFIVKEEAWVERSGIAGLTFLKCAFTPNGECFLLPSRIVKFGMYTKCWQPHEWLPLLRGHISSFGLDLPLNYPVLGALKRCVYNMKDQYATQRAKQNPALTLDQTAEKLKNAWAPDWEYSVQQDISTMPPREEIMAVICHRYDTTVREVEQLEADILKITSLPWHLANPLITRMAEVDY
jgi:hypothetical protein